MADTVGFEVLPRRWVVERTLAWLNRNRRLAKDFEASIASAKAWLFLASVQLLIRRVARGDTTFTISVGLRREIEPASQLIRCGEIGNRFAYRCGESCGAPGVRYHS